MEISTTPPTQDEEVLPMWKGGAILPPNSPFSLEVFKLLRPIIPAQGWPVGQPITALFEPLPNGLGLKAEFEHLSPDGRRDAEYAILGKGASLVLDSPAAFQAILVYKAKSLRDVALYALVPILFIIPIINGLISKFTHFSIALSVLDFAVLIAAQLRLGILQKKLKNSRFIAHIPTPGMKVSIAHKPPLTQR